MNYIERDAELIRQQIPDGTEIPAHSEALFRAYAVLMRAKGANTRCEDVHDAWAAWISETDPGACQFFCVWGLEVGGNSVGVGGGELGEGLFPVGGGVSLDEAGVSCSFVGGFACVCEALGGSFVFDVADSQP